MATAIIPIIAAAAPLVRAAYPILKPIAEKLILGVEHLFGAGNGPQVKMPAVLGALGPIAAALGTSGKIPGQLDASGLAAIAESVVQSLKDAGLLTPEAASAIMSQPTGVSTVSPGTLRIIGGTLQLQIG